MRLKFVIFILAFSLLQQNSLTAQRRIAISMHELSLDDPIFGISYLPAIVHYEQMPTRIRTLCQGFEDGQYWTFAHYQSGASEYFVVMGISRGQSGDSLGVAVQIKGKKCQTDDSEGMLSGHFSKSGYIKDATSDQLPGHNAPNVCPDGPSGSCY